MSKFMTEPIYSPRKLEQQWINGCIHLHDLCCGCPNPLNHLKFLLNKDSTCLHTTEEKGTTTEETGGTTTADEINIDAGDLEALFANTDDDLG
nr:MAG: hypothetical protein [Betatorquevirus sp.]